jgi:hypothetical protein
VEEPFELHNVAMHHLSHDLKLSILSATIVRAHASCKSALLFKQTLFPSATAAARNTFQA